MSIRNASIPKGATYAPTGGTATSLAILSQEAGKVNSYIADAGVTVQNRTEIQFSATLPKANVTAPGGFTQARSSVVLKTPKTLANLKRTINTVRVEFAFDPETTQAEVAALKSNIIAIVNDSDFDSFWMNQSAD